MTIGEFTLSIIVVHHRTPGLLRECLVSIARVGARRHEVLVVDVPDDAGRHWAPTKEELAQATILPRLRILRMESNLGYGAACNLGSACTTGQALLFLNADVRLDPGDLSGYMSAFAADETLGLAGFTLWETHRNPAPSRLEFPRGPGRIFWNLAVHRRPRREEAQAIVLPVTGVDPLPADWVLGAAMLVRRKAFDAIGGFDEKFFLYFEEVDLCRRLWSAGWRVVTLPTARAFHMHGASSSDYPQGKLHAIRYASQKRYFRKHHGRIGWIAGALDRSCLRWRL
jgi:Predicted glycosyltransferases